MELKDVYLLKYNGYGYGDGDGDGDGNGNGNGNGDGNGYGNGNGNGNGNGYGYGDGDGNGDGNGYGNGNGNGYGDGNGNGYGNGNGVYYMKLWGEWFEVSGELENSLCNNIPEHLYNKINKQFLQKVNNLELLRILREKIGLEKYIELFEAKLINEEIDNQGNKMKLYKYNEKGTTVILLEVICPSTDRIYHLYPVNQKAITCIEAKRSTFANKEIQYRHGDVGLVNIHKGFKYPLSES